MYIYFTILSNVDVIQCNIVQESWSGLPLPTPGDLSNPGTKTASAASLALAAGSHPCTTWEAHTVWWFHINAHGEMITAVKLISTHYLVWCGNYLLPSFHLLHPPLATPSFISVFMLLFSCSVMSDLLRPHGLQHTRLSCPSPSPGACSNSCPLSQWGHATISSPAAAWGSP